MTGLVAYGLAIIALMVAITAGRLVRNDQQVDNPLFYAVTGVTLLTVLQLVGGIIALAGTDRSVSGVTFVSYLLTTALIGPAAVLWGVSDKSRWGPGVVCIGMITIAVLEIRLLQIWTTGG